MATILITGNTRLFTLEAYTELAAQYRLVIAGEVPFSIREKNIRLYSTMPREEKFSQLFDVYSFQAVYYVTGYADGGEGMFGEMEQLEQTFLECGRSKVEKLILLSTVDSRNYLEHYGRSGEIIKKDYPFGRAFGAAKIEETARYFAEKTRVPMVILWLPYVADRINDTNFLGRIFLKMREEKKVLLPYHKEDRVDFISMPDLVSLLFRITEETEDEGGDYYVSSGYEYQYGDLEELLKLCVPDLQVIYENYPNTSKIPRYPVELRKKYGFVPVDNVMENIGSYYRRFTREIYQGKGKITGKAVAFLKKAGGSVFKYLEILVLFVLAELLSRYTSNSVYFKFVDVRLFYIVIVGTTYGMRMGILGALLECIVLIRQYANIGMNGVLLFYNIENWIPFVVYLMAGSITGYIKNKKTDELEFSRVEYNLLRNKYLFLNDVYHGAMQNKGEYKRQILGYKDSFGKIFDAVQKLDNELPESIFLEGLQIMEDILENHSIAIYTLDSWQRFGRLAVCSNSQLTKLTKSIRMEDYQELYETVKRREVWKNSEMADGMPMYACGVFKDDALALLITIQEASTEQYGTHYMNIFRILCGLVQTSFLRAVEYESLTEEKTFYPGTNVVYPDRLNKLVSVQQDMKDAGVADYVLVKFESKDKAFVSESLSGMIRATDTLGADGSGSLYLLLLQMNRQNFPVVGDKLNKKRLSYQLVEKVG